jgi:hypothetical protein
VIAVSVLVGLALTYAGLNAVKMLFWSAVLNGVLAPPLVILVVLLTSDKKVMGKRANSRGAQVLEWICAVLMSAAALPSSSCSKVDAIPTRSKNACAGFYRHLTCRLLIGVCSLFSAHDRRLQPAPLIARTTWTILQGKSGIG